MTTRTAAGVLTTLVAIAAAALVWHALPANTTIYAPFDVRAPIGTPAVGRGVTAKVTAAQLAPVIVDGTSGRRIPAVGTWLVPTVTLESGPTFEYYHADLLVGPNTYAPSDRLLTGALLQPGIAEERQWAFDVPRELLDTVDSAVLRVWVGDGRLDSRLILDIPLNSPRVERADSVRVSKPAWSAA